MGIPEVYDDSFIAGDTYKLNMIYKDSSGVLIDLTGYTVDMHLKKSYDANEYVLEKSFEISSVEGEAGEINISLTVDDTNSLGECSIIKSSYVYDVQLTNITGDEVQTILGGTFTIYRGVTTT